MINITMVGPEAKSLQIPLQKALIETLLEYKQGLGSDSGEIAVAPFVRAYRGTSDVTLAQAEGIENLFIYSNYSSEKDFIEHFVDVVMNLIKKKISGRLTVGVV